MDILNYKIKKLEELKEADEVDQVTKVYALRRSEKEKALEDTVIALNKCAARLEEKL